MKRSILAAITLMALPLMAVQAAPKGDQGPPLVEAVVVNTPLDVAVVNTEVQPQPVNICGEFSPFAGRQLIYTVPADRQLRIEDSTFDPTDSMEAGEIVQVTIVTVAGGAEGAYLIDRVSGDDFAFAHGARLMSVYADPDTDVLVAIGIRNYLADVEVCLSGILLPLD